MSTNTVLVILFVLVAFAVTYCVALDFANANPTVLDQPKLIEQQKVDLKIAAAYACGMLDAIQEKRHRPQACEEYRAIAKKNGVGVPP